MSSNYNDHDLLLADIYAYQGLYTKACNLYIKKGHYQQAIELYLDLRNWQQAKELISHIPNVNNQQQQLEMNKILIQQADWLIEMNEIALADLYWTAQQYEIALEIYHKNQWYDQLMIKIRALTNTHDKVDILNQAALYLKANDQKVYCIELYQIMGNIKSLINLYIEYKQWDDAFQLAANHTESLPHIYLPYAEWLVMNDRFEEARNAFQHANQADQSLHMLYDLKDNALHEHRYQDAAYCYYILTTSAHQYHTADQLYKRLLCLSLYLSIYNSTIYIH